ncbi:ABC transporter ATP-binding protein [Pigmentiphaga sp. H8]|uniref:ABC transporter ATP-binding protein n=1 Tax=unclassified Pigmentiphaga TaxID=2626614 RepID=UPI000F5A31E5|nr:ATP-binding cassette domain-containing protein [Pigmentiphaga sp. H8]AZG06677.1 ABC transporter ATP-binding protein [Pigmentiphaga sp. H8]
MNQPLIEISGLAIDYPARRRLGGPRERIRVVEGVDLSLDAGQTLGLVGESGSGKSSIGQTLLGAVPPAAGRIRVAQWDVGALRHRDLRAYRRTVQMVWQNPYASLTPTLPVGEQIGEPLRTDPGMDAAARSRRVAQLLDQVGLRAADAAKLPHQFSGGQRQRVAIARALAPSPRLIVLDEPVSALDVITQAQILRLLEAVQRETRVAYLLISHDIGVVRYLSDRVAVLRRGCLVESGDADQVCERPAHAYTRELIGSILEPGPLEPLADEMSAGTPSRPGPSWGGTSVQGPVRQRGECPR